MATASSRVGVLQRGVNPSITRTHCRPGEVAVQGDRHVCGEETWVSSRGLVALSAVVVALAVPAVACGSDGGDAAQDATTTVTRFEDRTIDTWPAGDDERGTVSHVSGLLRDGQPFPCTLIEVDGVPHAVTWPPDSVRSDAGITANGRLHRFDEQSSFEVVEDYKGPSRPVTCLTTNGWLVVR